MLTSQQAAAKEAAHNRFDNPARIAAQDQDGLTDRDDLPRFTQGIEGIGIADDSIRVYILKGHEEAVEIPSEFEGLRTERFSTAGFGILAPARQNALSPVPGGVSIGHYKVSAGTLGCLVETPGALCILSNNHVLANTNAGVPGDDILQPGPHDLAAGSSARRIAGLTDYEPLRFGSAVNHIDAAIAALDDPNSAIPSIMGIGRHANPPVAAFLNQSVAKHGRTTGLTFGKVVDISFDGNVRYSSRVAYFEDQIAIIGESGPFSDDGDSGSLVLDSPGSRAVGLLFAGDGSHTLANRIQPILNRFNGTIVTP
ncbi:MAG: hypothetical protein OXT64_12420 [Gammaproteobacteria bacterium]|nr:hypothetical protein [Gammaproteobacteria bacterium]